MKYVKKVQKIYKGPVYFHRDKNRHVLSKDLNIYSQFEHSLIKLNCRTFRRNFSRSKGCNYRHHRSSLWQTANELGHNATVVASRFSDDNICWIVVGCEAHRAAIKHHWDQTELQDITQTRLLLLQPNQISLWKLDLAHLLSIRTIGFRFYTTVQVLNWFSLVG